MGGRSIENLEKNLHRFIQSEETADRIMQVRLIVFPKARGKTEAKKGGIGYKHSFKDASLFPRRSYDKSDFCWLRYGIVRNNGCIRKTGCSRT